jgi:hypothetical protein
VKVSSFESPSLPVCDRPSITPLHNHHHEHRSLPPTTLHWRSAMAQAHTKLAALTIAADPPADEQTTRAIPVPAQTTAPESRSRSRLAVDAYSPVNQNGSFEFDRVIKSGYVQKRTQKTKVRPTSVHLHTCARTRILTKHRHGGPSTSSSDRTTYLYTSPTKRRSSGARSIPLT